MADSKGETMVLSNFLRNIFLLHSIGTVLSFLHHPPYSITKPHHRKDVSFSSSVTLSTSNNTPHKVVRTNHHPKVIIFDLDGCLWLPEMYEINFFQGGRGPPFTTDPYDPQNLLTSGGESVRLIGDVRSVMAQLYSKEIYQGIPIGISSRTDEPNWARQLLQQFPIPTIGSDDDDETVVSLVSVFNGPIEIAKDSKVQHFRRIFEQCGVLAEEVLFFDNEYRNCESVAELGCSVVYCPDGVTQELFDLGFEKAFPRKDGTVIVGDGMSSVW